MAGDAIVVGEDWISEHYFTTDATKESFKARVLARRAEWDEQKEHGTPRSRFTAIRSSLLDRFATLDLSGEQGVADVRALNAAVRALLGYDGPGLTTTTRGPVTFVTAPGLEGAPSLAIVDALPGETHEALLAKDAGNLAEPFVPGDDMPTEGGKDAVTSVARLLSTLFVHDDYKPAFALVLAGPHLLVAERERWPEGRYLAVDLQLVAERNDDKRGGEVDRALNCVAADSLAPDAQGDVWWTETLAQSVKHTVGVSRDLREGVRLSIEIIANEVVARRHERGLDPLPAAEAQPLAKQSLRFLYRILFLLYAEASPELGVLPSGAPEYEQGYSLDRLRELVLVELTTQKSRSGTHLHKSLGTLFRLVDRGHDPDAGTNPQHTDGLRFRSLRADLFKPEATAHVDEVGLGNDALQRVLRHLLLSKEQRGRDRGFISYAELGINQLGAVYEGLMSYTGFFAETDLYEVAKDGNAEKGSWVVPVERAEGIDAKDFVRVLDETGEPRAVLHREGSFVFRLAGRERQQSASYYTPEVLTRFVVSQALEELLDQGGTRTTAAEVLELTICEPALGSGAFAIEAVRQLAEQYLNRRQNELGETVVPEDYPRELQRVKAHLALHNTYGVDLNATAVELAEISLWLDTMVEGLHAPWFGLHLRRGNSLIGARKAVYSRATVGDKAWLSAVPRPVGHGEDAVAAISGTVPHFLLPAEGWGAAADVGKEVKDLVPDRVAALKSWRRSALSRPTRKQVDALVEMGRRVERLWTIAGQRLAIAEQQVRRDIPLWGTPAAKSRAPGGRIVTREEIEASLADPDGAYRRLRLVMDAWCALWFWPLTEDPDDGGATPPTLTEWYDALTMLLGSDTMSAKVARKGDDTLQSALTWDELGDVETNDRIYAGAARVTDAEAAHPWLAVCRRVAEQQGFFHWALEFAPVLDQGGFDLQVGNPPWVRPRSDVEALLAEGDPWWQLKGKVAQQVVLDHRKETLDLPGVEPLVVGATADVTAMATFLGSPGAHPHLAGLQPDLYRCFMERTWSHQAPTGVVALIHPESHLTDEKARTLRSGTYRRLRRHWQFVNELALFEVHHLVSYGVHVYGAARDEPRFLQATSLYHPDTVERSIQHNGDGPEPGLKDDEGHWDLRPHHGRVLTVDTSVLTTWHELLEGADVPVLQTRMVYTVNRASAAVLDKLASADRLGSLGLQFSAGWHEKNDRTKGYFDSEWGRPATWDDVILQGPHFHVGNPFYKQPNPTMLHNQDWSPVDLETLPADAVPVTSYKPATGRSRYDAGYTHWSADGSIAARDHFRIAWRKMAANTGERTLITGIYPPGTSHIDGVQTLAVGSGDVGGLLRVQAVGMSLVADFMVRAAPKANIRFASWDSLPAPDVRLRPAATVRVLRLVAVTQAYAPLWDFVECSEDLEWTGGHEYSGRPPLVAVSKTWNPEVPLRRASDRRQAILEIDAIVALSLGLTANELCTVYRTQFPVLHGYDRTKYVYDTNGREVPTPILQLWRSRGLDQTSVEGLSEEERTHTNASGNTYVYEMPFVTLDREADMRQAYAHFETVLAERG